jgi:predicted house-cleaning noncanonical NTP pyrophosphatase (MazG superfamily)
MPIRVLFARDLRAATGSPDAVASWIPTIGSKAAGLLHLPQQWVPADFAVITGLSRDQSDVTDLDQVAHKVLSGLTRSASVAPLIVRSSGANESLRSRGSFKTETCASEPAALVQTIKAVLAGFRGDEVGSGDKSYSVLIHEYIPSEHFGHLSNERRVGTIRSFIGEVWTRPSVGSTSVFTLQSKKDVPQPDEAAGIPIVEGNIEDALRRLARWVHKHIARAHLEWIVSAGALIVVQCDVEVAVDVPAPMSHWRDPIGLFDPRELQVLEAATKENSADLRKTSARIVFGECSLPTAPLYLLRDNDLLEAIVNGKIPEGLSIDFEAFSAFPFVIRVDVVAAGNEAWENLPASGVLRTPGEASDFLLRALPVARERVRRTADLAIVVHHFITARAAAWAEAVPASGRVRIDAIWGHPDGLQGFPCDSVYMCFPENQHYEFRRFKDEYLDIDPTGKSYRRANGPPWDKQPVLEDSYAEEIAAKTLVVAKHLAKAVRIMWFVGTAPRANMPKCFPWIIVFDFQATADQFLAGNRDAPFAPRGDTVSQARRLAIGSVRRIETELDLADFDKSPGEFDLGDRRVVLRPEAGLIRSKGFLGAVADKARQGRWRLVLEGSTLAHSFYLLRSMGVDVEAAAEYLGEPRRKKIYRKLVRDLIPQHILAQGQFVDFRKIPRGELKPALLRKLQEESAEAVLANSDTALLEELADVFEVVRALAEECGGGLTDVIDRAERKRRKKGGFNAGYELVATGGTGEPREKSPQLELFGDNARPAGNKQPD